jgi:hypothetical protein
MDRFMENGGGAALVMMVIGGVLLVTLVIHIFVCWLLYGTYERIPARFRLMEAGLVWLLLVPCFSLVWNFFVYPKLSRSFKAYFDSVNDPTVGDCGAQIALFYSIAAACAVIPCVNYVAGPAALVLLIVYLIKAHELKKRIPPGTV